ncbi:MAG: hypothetical protein COA73_03875 [Candidatus Hydrogenedentota bacterium]|nr:MAG: hypothetical protein COA73_03875 [Candidatus Hydrogenedentota bacterium]
MPIVTSGDGVTINTRSPQQSKRTFTLSGGNRQETFRVSYYSKALKEGKITIPPVEVLINGKKMKSDPIELTVLPSAAIGQADQSGARLWVDKRTITAGKPFWIYLEASGLDVDLPPVLRVAGLRIDTRNVQSSMSYSFNNRGGQVLTLRKGFMAVADTPGIVTIPAVDIRIGGKKVETKPIDLYIIQSTATSIPTNPSVGPAGQQSESPSESDLVFIEMDTDKVEVFQGEPILMTTGLWRINYRRVSSGPYRGALIQDPTTEGFYVHELEPTVYDMNRGSWSYEVTERRKLLYPTHSGTLEIGRWHWEGIARYTAPGFYRRKDNYYKLDVGPIEIVVKPLPPGPAGFSGAVGEFQVASRLDSNTMTEGIPVKFTVTIRGLGNPDAIGAPKVPELTWGSLSGPEVTTMPFTPLGEKIPHMSKTFVYTLTPTHGGDTTLPKFDCVYFDPRKGDYQSEAIGPFRVNVMSSTESPRHLVVPRDVALAQRGVDILAEDIQPLLPAPDSLERYKSPIVLIGLGVVTPPVLYVFVTLLVMRRRKLETDVGYARGYRAKHKSMKRLQDVLESPEPESELFNVVTDYIGNKLNVHESGMTSSDVDKHLQSRGVDDDTRENIGKILIACERARYASQHLSKQELNALVYGAEASLHELDLSLKKGGRS